MTRFKTLTRALRAHARLLVWAAIVMALAALLPGSAFADALDDQVREIARGLRCPVCENVSTADSQSELAGQMRLVIRDQLLQGKTREQITAYFLERYGESVLFEPPKRGFSLLAWVVTPAGLLVGALVVGRMLAGRRRADPTSAEAPASDASGSGPADAAPRDELEPYRARVRAHLAEEGP
ncbi:MAG TPA: cytochrome c-type biogenesis protein [Chloroflexota bacterium]|nr:cytochrome c-type biogenesis protein [Chloroflexota bacterium]